VVHVKGVAVAQGLAVAVADRRDRVGSRDLSRQLLPECMLLLEPILLIRFGHKLRIKLKKHPY
jgi:hypothetical protein